MCDNLSTAAWCWRISNQVSNLDTWKPLVMNSYLVVFFLVIVPIFFILIFVERIRRICLNSYLALIKAKMISLCHSTLHDNLFILIMVLLIVCPPQKEIGIRIAMEICVKKDNNPTGMLKSDQSDPLYFHERRRYIHTQKRLQSPNNIKPFVYWCHKIASIRE